MKQEDEMAERMAKKFRIAAPTACDGSASVVSSLATNGKANGSGLHDALSKFLDVAGKTMNMWLLQLQMATNASNDVRQRFANSLLEKEIAKMEAERNEIKNQKQKEGNSSLSTNNHPPGAIDVEVGSEETTTNTTTSNYNVEQEEEEEEDLYGA